MAEGNALIAALRANTAPSGAMPSGVKQVSFPWQKNSTGPLVIPNRSVAKAAATAATPTTTTAKPTPPTPPTQKTAEDFINNNFRYQDLPGYGGDNWDRMTGNNQNPTALVLDANKNRVEYVDTANPVLNYAQNNPQPPPASPVATIGMDEMGDKFGLNVGDFANLPVGDVPSDGTQAALPQAAPAPVAATTPVTDEMSVRQTLEQILADKNPQVVAPPTAAPMPEVNIPAFDSGINFQMPAELFATPAPFVPGFTPDADVYAAMQAPAPVVQEPAPLDPALLAMLGMPQAPAPVQATQPVPEEPIYAAELPSWYFSGLEDYGLR